MTIFPEPSNEVPLTVLIEVPETSVFCFPAKPDVNAASVAKGLPPAVTPSCTTTVSFVVSIYNSPSAPVNAFEAVVSPLLNLNTVGID